MPGIAKIRCEITDSTESKNGLPMPAGRSDIIHSITPPSESPLLAALSKASFHGFSPPISRIEERTDTGSIILLAITPAATIPIVTLPE